MKNEMSGLDAFRLKLIALVCMTIDHIAQFLEPVLPIPFWFHIIGRIAAPVFIYLTAWGAHYTHNRAGYMRRLYLFSAGMSLAALCVNRFAELSGLVTIPNNIFATLFLIVLYIELIERMLHDAKHSTFGRALLDVVLLMIPILLFALTELIPLLLGGAAGYWVKGLVRAFLPDALSCEGSIFIVFLGVALYFLRGSRRNTAIFYIIYCIFELVIALTGGIHNALTVNVQWMMLLALPLLLCYNGRRGPDTPFTRYLFYIYYPAHIFGLYACYCAIIYM